MRYLVLFVLFGLLSGCSVAPFAKSIKPHPELQSQLQGQELFLAAWDEFSATNKVELLQQFQRQSPDSTWAKYAGTIIHSARALAENKTQLATLREDNMRLHAERDSLQQGNDQLSEKIEQFKILLIELEQRPK